MNNDDVVGLCLLGISELVLLGHELRYTVPEWCFRLVDNINAWNIYPWGSYVWPTLYEQLRDANVKRWETHFATERQPDSGRPKYSLMGFTWAFKGAQPSPRLTPDVVEAQAEWWLASKAFFDGHIREPLRIPPLVNQHSRDDVPECIYQRVVEQDNLLKAQPMRGVRPIKGPVYVGEHYGLRWFSKHGGCHESKKRDSCPGLFLRSLYMPLPLTTSIPKKQADKSRKKTSNANISAFDLGMAVGDDNARDNEVRITGTRSTVDFISLENVDPNKEELVPQMYKAGVDPGPDPAKVGWLSDDLLIRTRPDGARCIVAKSKTASLNPGSNIFLLQTNRHLRGTLDGSTRPYPSWSDVDWVYMPINAEDSKRRTFWSLNEDILKIIVSKDQYAVSIKEDTAYPCLHSPKTTED
ncbi:hypothetical protein Tco_0001062 [Tanacetum coccineum]